MADPITPGLATAFSNTGPAAITPAGATAFDNTAPATITPGLGTVFSNTGPTHIDFDAAAPNPPTPPASQPDNQGAEAVTLNRLLQIPAEIGWPSTFPLGIEKFSNGYKTTVNPRSLVNAAIWTGPVYHVDVLNGNNSNSGLGSFEGDFSLAVRDINAAITLGNATSAPYRVLIRGGTNRVYRDTHSINGRASGWPTPPTGALVEPTQHCALIGHGGRVDHRASKSVASFPTTKDGTYTNCYVVSSCEATRRVMDFLDLTALGVPEELTRLTSEIATCDTTPNSFFQSGSTLYLHRADGVAPTYANTGIYCNTYTAAFLSCTTDLYFEGIDFSGGNSGALYIDPASTRNVVAVDCTFKYAGTLESALDGLRIRRVTGRVFIKDCEAIANVKDGFNFHADGSSGMFVVTDGCAGYDNGKFTSTSNNDLTYHDNVVGIDVGGVYGPTKTGANIHIIETSKLWCLGTRGTRTVLGGSGNAVFKASNTAELYLQETFATCEAANQIALHAQGTAALIATLNHTTTLGTNLQESGTTIEIWEREATA